MNIHILAGFIAIAAASMPISAQGVWQEVASTGPSAREAFGMAYDSTRQTCVLFGGAGTAAPLLGETWTWNGSTWSQHMGPSPSARRDHAMAFDSVRGHVVLFGGYDGTARSDTWEWDGTSWSLRTPANVPNARHRHAMAFDSYRGRVVLFGGVGSALNMWGDTWEWDGFDWTQVVVATAPAARMGLAMAFDSGRGKTVLFGGATSISGLASFFNDTWEWDGANWTLASTGGVAPRDGHAMAYDSVRSRILSTGGWNGSVQSIDLAWDGTSWSPAGNTWGIGRYAHSMVFDSARGRMVAFGGTTNGIPFIGTTSELLHTVGSATPYGAACGNPALSLSQSAHPRIGGTPHVTVSSMQSPSAYLAIGWTNDFYGTSPLPLSLDFMGLTGCLLHHSAEVQGIPFTYLGQGTGELVVPIPNSPQLVGLHLYFQAYAEAPGANPAGFTTSNGLAWTIGI